jgi:hypothetical protein
MPNIVAIDTAPHRLARSHPRCFAPNNKCGLRAYVDLPFEVISVHLIRWIPTVAVVDSAFLEFPLSRPMPRVSERPNGGNVVQGPCHSTTNALSLLTRTNRSENRCRQLLEHVPLWGRAPHAVRRAPQWRALWGTGESNIESPRKSRRPFQLNPTTMGGSTQGESQERRVEQALGGAAATARYLPLPPALCWL